MLLILFIGREVIQSPTSEHSSPSTAFAGGIAVFDNPPSMVFTCSEDGKTLYRWQCDPKSLLNEPKYLGKTEAILTE